MELKDFLKVEEQFPIENFCFSCDDIIMWPFVRHTLIDHFLGRNQINKKKQEKTKKIPFLKQFFFYNPFFYKNKRNIFISDEIYSMQKENENDKFFNRMIDYYLSEISEKDFLVLERIRYGQKLKRDYNSIAIFNNISDIANKISKLKRVNSQDKKNIDDFIIEIKKYFELNSNLENKIRKNLKRLSKELFIYKTLFFKLFKNTKVETLFFTRGFIEKSYIVKWAKKFGIRTIEIQHCIIGKEKAPYLFSDSVSKKLKPYFVDSILTYGDYWNSNIKMDVEKISIGNPFYENQIEELKKKNITEDEKRILIISQPEIRQNMIDLTIKLKKIKSEYKIIFRFHPVKDLSLEHRNELETNEIKIDKEKNVYESISQSKHVIGCFSTVLYEAIGIGEKNIYVLKNSFSKREINDEFGIWFETVEELSSLIDSMKLSKLDIVEQEKIFKKNAKKNFKQVLKLD